MAETLRLITARYNGKCAECEEPIEEGDLCIYDFDAREIYCEECGEQIT